MKPWRRDDADKMSGDVRTSILNRDKVCFLFMATLNHICRDQWGQVHMPNDLLKLTVDHVKKDLRMGDRAQSRLETGVAMCFHGNNKPPTKVERAAERAYLRKLYPAFWASDEPG
jgi:hypothetical protein